jgi:hypothetical protein
MRGGSTLFSAAKELLTRGAGRSIARRLVANGVLFPEQV